MNSFPLSNATRGEENYRRFRKLVRDYFVVNIDYKITTLKAIEGSVVGTTDPLTGEERQKLGGKSAQTQIYVFSRATFHRICITYVLTRRQISPRRTKFPKNNNLN